MASGTYVLQKQCQGGSRKDSSFRSFLCALLVFFAICMIIVLAGNWKSIVGEKEKSTDKHEEIETEQFYQNKTNKTHDKINVFNTSPGTKFTTSSDNTGSTVANVTATGSPTTTESPTTDPSTTTTITTTSPGNTESTEADETSTGSPTTTASPKTDPSTTTNATTTSSDNTGSTVANVLDTESSTTTASPKTDPSTTTNATTTSSDNTGSTVANVLDTESPTTTASPKTDPSTTTNATTTSSDNTGSTVANVLDTESSTTTASPKTDPSTTTNATTTSSDNTGSTVANVLDTESPTTTASPTTDPSTTTTINTTSPGNTESTEADETSTGSPTTTVSPPTDPRTTTTATTTSSDNTGSTVANVLDTESPTTTASPTTDPSTTTTINTTSPGNTESTEADETSTGSPTTTASPTKNENINSASTQSNAGDKNAETTQQSNVCQTGECKSVSSRMLYLMNHSIDKCKDFYAFSCGGMQRDSADSAVWDILLKKTTQISDTDAPYLNKFKDFFNSCLKYQHSYDEIYKINEVNKALSKNGINNKTDETKLISIMLSLNVMPFMDITNGIHESNRILELRLPMGSLDDADLLSSFWANKRRCLPLQRNKGHSNTNEMYASYTKCQRNLTDYKDLMKNALTAFKIPLDGLDQTVETIATLLNETHPPTQVKIKEAIINEEFTILNVSEVIKKYEQINYWMELLQISYDNVDQSTLLRVYFQDYFEAWLDIFNRIENKRTFLYNMLITDMYYNFVIRRNSPKHLHDECLKTATKLFGDIASNLYLSDFSDEIYNSQKGRTETIFKEVKEGLNSIFLEKKETKAAQTLAELKIQFSNMYSSEEEDKLNLKYNPINITEDYLSQFISLQKLNKKMFLSQDGFGPLVNSFDKQAKSFYGTNTIYVPFGMVANVPLNIPYEIELSKIGYHLAKAIAMHFDPVGVELENILTQQIVSQRTDPVLEFTNNTLSKNEQISDIIAMRMVIETYSKNKKKGLLLPWVNTDYSQEKILFISIVQECCDDENDFMERIHESNILPGSIRVSNIIQNSKKFSDVFECKKKGSEEIPTA